MANQTLEKFTKNKPLFYGTLAVIGVGAIWYYRHKQASASAAAGFTDPAGNTCSAPNPATGFCPGTAEDQQAMTQLASTGFVGQPQGGGTFGSTGGATGGGNITNQITTKEEWVRAAENFLPNGHSTEVRNALLGVLGGLTVTSAERRIFLEAVGGLGDPPGGYPKPIKVSDSTGHPGGSRVTVPNVIGKEHTQAAQALRAAGLAPHATVGTEISWIVGKEIPSAGTRVSRGSGVTISPRSATGGTQVGGFTVE
jgi:hypothetical protein